MDNALDKEQAIVTNLTAIMEREERFLREILGVLTQEQHALAKNDTDLFRSLNETKISLNETLRSLQHERAVALKALADLFYGAGYDENEAFKGILNKVKDGSAQLSLLKKQLIELYEKTKVYQERNDYLVQNRLQLSRKIMKKVQKTDETPVYTALARKASPQNRVSLINREG